MKIEVVDTIPYPLETVFRTLRDEMDALVPYLPNVDEIVVKERKELDDGAVELVNWWRASSEIPAIARAFVKPDMTNWTDFAIWDERDWSCEWRQETAFFTERIRCAGKNAYRSLDRDRTRLTIRGDLTIDLKGLKGVPRLMAPAVGAGVEKFVVSLITPNFKKLSEGLVGYLRDNE